MKIRQKNLTPPFGVTVTKMDLLTTIVTNGPISHLFRDKKQLQNSPTPVYIMSLLSGVWNYLNKTQ